MGTRRSHVALVVVAVVAALVPASLLGAPPAAADIVDLPSSIGGGDSHTCAVGGDGGVTCWGANGFGQLGDGTLVDSPDPVPVDGLASGVAEVTTGWAHSCVLTDAGTVRCWGLGTSGQLGNGSTASPQPVVDVVGLDPGVRSVAAGQFHTCAIDADGALWCWGDNSHGQLGDGTTTPSSTPVPVTGLSSGVAAVSAGNSTTCALLDTGGMRCWGNNADGGVGDGTTVDRSTPVDVVGLGSGVVEIATGGNLGSRACAVLETGAAMCWGDNDLGQLGTGDTTPRSVPTDVVGLSSGVMTISTGSSQTCALMTDGSVRCWGMHGTGTGDPFGTMRTTPVAVVGIVPGAREVISGNWHACAVTDTGGVKCWGGNLRGQIGVPSTTALGRLPVDVSGSFHRPECPTLLPADRTTVVTSDGLAVASEATFEAEGGYVLTGPDTITCQADLTWDGTPPAAARTYQATVSPATALVGGQEVTLELTGYGPGTEMGWCQGVSGGDASPDRCGAALGQGTVDSSGNLTTVLRLERHMFVPALGHWVDCAVPGTGCVVGVAVMGTLDLLEVLPLEFAPPPPPPTEIGRFTFVPASSGLPGEPVTVTGDHYRPNAVVDAYQCRWVPTHPADCVRLGSSTTTDGTGAFTFVTTPQQTIAPPLAPTVDCVTAMCSLAVAEAADAPATMISRPLAFGGGPLVVVPQLTWSDESTGGTSAGTVEVRLTRPDPDPVDVRWETYVVGNAPPGQATAGADYVPASGTVRIEAGETSATVEIDLVGDAATEPDEYLVIRFFSPSKGRMGGVWGCAFLAIADDD